MHMQQCTLVACIRCLTVQLPSQAACYLCRDADSKWKWPEQVLQDVLAQPTKFKSELELGTYMSSNYQHCSIALSAHKASQTTGTMTTSAMKTLSLAWMAASTVITVLTSVLS